MSAFTNFIRSLFRPDTRERTTPAAIYGHGLEAFERRKTMYYGRGVLGLGFAPRTTRRSSSD